MQLATTMLRSRTARLAPTLALAAALAGACSTGTEPDLAKGGPPPPAWRQLVTSVETTCGLRDPGVVYCVSASDTSAVPRALPAPPGGPVATISVGNGAGVCALGGDGVVRCWDGARWTAPIGEDRRSTQLSGDAEAGCALTGEGTPWCWWLERVPRSSQVVLHLAPVTGAPPLTRVGYGYHYACGLAGDGTAYCWNVGPVTGTTGQLGNGTLQASATAVPVRTDVRFASLAVGTAHACALTAAGEAWCWGSNMGNALGVPRDVPREGCGSGTQPAAAPHSWATHWCTTPQRVETARRFSSLVAANERTCDLAYGATVYCWGANRGLTLGAATLPDGTCQLLGPLSPAVACTSRLTAVTGNLRFIALGLDRGGHHQCAIGIDGRIHCWGMVAPDGRPARLLFGPDGSPVVATERPVALPEPGAS